MSDRYDEFDSDEEAQFYARMAIARAIRNLGNADAATPMGGLEALGKVLSEAMGENSRDYHEELFGIEEALTALPKAIWGTLQSPNEADSNMEPANIVDGLFAISRSIRFLARAILATSGMKPEDLD